MSIYDIRAVRPTLADRAADARAWAENCASIAKMGLRVGPRRMAGHLSRIKWLPYLLQTNVILDMMTRSRTGAYREANAHALSGIVAGLAESLGGLLSDPEKLVLHEDLVPPEILMGMGLTPWMLELLGIVAPMIASDFAEPYIDAAEAAGTPPDVCSLPKATMGLALMGQFPKPAAMVTSNMPCDGGMASYTVLEKSLSVPTFRLDTPYDFHSERAVTYFTGELFRMIEWLEEHTPGRMDWDRMREVCEERNRAAEAELALWDLMTRKPAPMAGEPVYLGHMMYMIASPATPLGTRYFQDLLARAEKIAQSGQGVLPEERYRAVLWNPPTLIYPELFVRAEQEWGVALLMDMLSFHRHPLVDTKTPESMLRGLARIIMQGAMSRHTRGPQANFFSDLFHVYERFDLDMIWMAGHIGCKNTMALSGMFREKCRERGIPLLIINYDLSDSRVVAPHQIRDQADAFMETVMKAERVK
ncbi:MAG: 2-hydroxyacyl-CoA dehydratase family protein [Proteobacteria bacterium]|nr:2-hydroxyacyl-CoA dehydratase family protein [Pseudomonadota bacterium]